MAEEIPRLLTEYGLKLATINTNFAMGKPTDKSQIYTALDKIDPIKLMQNPNPDIAAKAAQLQLYFLPVETADQVTDFIYKLNIEADQLVASLTNITLDYTTEFLEILKDMTAVMESIVRNLLSLVNMIVYLTLLLVLQILYHVLVDIFQTMLNLALIGVWITYASLFFIPDSIAPPDMRAPENGAFIMGVLIPWQIMILVLYLVYILIEITLYIVNYVISILFLVIQSVSTISRRVLEVVMLFEASLQQVTGVAGMIPLIVSVEASKTAGTSVLMTQLVNPLPI